MKKYRVVQKGDEYYPQRRFMWLFWVPIYVSGHGGEYPAKFHTLREAIMLVAKHSEGTPKQKKIVVWEN